MESLCQDYWPPVYAYIRRQGRSEQDAQDLTQDFFHRIIRRDWFAKADPSRGRLRNYLFTSLVNFLRDTFRSEQAEKRGQGRLHLSLEGAEGGYHREAVDHLSPDRLFQRRWALHLVEKALMAVESEYAGRGQQAVFHALQERLLGPGSGDDNLAGIAQPLGLSAGAIRAALYRLRGRFRERLYDEVGQTIGSLDPREIRDEMSELLQFL